MFKSDSIQERARDRTDPETTDTQERIEKRLTQGPTHGPRTRETLEPRITLSNE